MGNVEIEGGGKRKEEREILMDATVRPEPFLIIQHFFLRNKKT